jgi:hypothetical protein
MPANRISVSTGLFSGALVIFRDATIATAALGVLGLAVNLVHPERIPYIAEKEYEILVPCPEPGGEVSVIQPGDSVLREQGTFVVDARSREAFESWHFRKAANVTYDYLDPTPPETLQGLAKSIARSGARRVAVYGDGDNPDSGEQLAKEISGNGIKNVSFIEGGAPVLKAKTSTGGGK